MPLLVMVVVIVTVVVAVCSSHSTRLGCAYFIPSLYILELDNDDQ